MPRSKHTGQTDSGHTRDIKVERIGKVTIYKRGLAHYLYFRENGKSVRRPVEGSLAAARATAHKVAASLQEGSPSPLGFDRMAPEERVTAFIDYTRDVQGLALRSRDRYRAALERFKDFALEKNIKAIDLVSQASIEEDPQRRKEQVLRRTSSQHCSLSRNPAWTATSSFFPSAVAPMKTSMHARSSSSRTLK